MKVTFFDRFLLSKCVWIVAFLFGIITTVLTFFDTSERVRFWLFVIAVGSSVITYFLLLFHYNYKNSVVLHHEGTNIEIKVGDIFSDYYKQPKFIRVFGFNEYFDTEIGRGMISKNTLNGQVLLREFSDDKKLDERIGSDFHLNQDKNILNGNVARSRGKQTQYRLGSIFVVNENTFFTALSKFDDDNRAQLLISEYVEFLMNFWKEIDTLYDGDTVVIPLFGNGRTRLDNGINYEPQELLKIILWTFNLRKLKFEMPSKLIILLDENTNKQIDYFHLEEDFDGL